MTNRVHLNELPHFYFWERALPHNHAATGELHVYRQLPNGPDGITLMICAVCENLVCGWYPPDSWHPHRCNRTGNQYRDPSPFDRACTACGETTDLHADHLIPLALWRRREERFANSEANSNLLCRACNINKRALLPDPYYFAAVFGRTEHLVNSKGGTTGPHHTYLAENRSYVRNKYRALHATSIPTWQAPINLGALL